MNYLDDLLSSYRNKGVLVDTNLLLVYFVGLYDPDRIKRFNRTAAFTVEDFELLCQLLAFFNKVVTTPNILTEVNSLSNKLPDDLKPTFYPVFAQRLAVLEEHYVESKTASSHEYFDRFGLTDSGIISLVQGNYLVLTDDFKLAGYLQKINVDVINFNHIRSINWNI
ncbi:MAG TPA: PIN domain-containing protein [Pyrinomonadaceae bacterium]